MSHTLGSLLAASARAWPDQEIVFPAERIRLADLDERVTRMAHVLRAAGAEPGSHVGFLLSPGVNLITTLFAIARAGCVVVPVSDRLKAKELRHVITHADLRVLVTAKVPGAPVDFPGLVSEALGGLSGQVRPAKDEAPELARIVLLGDAPEEPGITPLAELSQAAAEVASADIFSTQAAVAGDDLAFIMYTSGTSADAKGCMIPHSNVVTQGRVLAEDRYGLTPADAFWCPLPLFHNGGLATLMACLTSGARFVHAGHFDPDVSLRQLEEERCTHALPTFETIWLPILDHPQFHEADLSALRMILNAGSEARLRQFQERMPHVPQLANYGSTECTGHFSMTLPTDPLEIALTTGGRPLPGMEARVVDPVSGVDQPAAVEGEILVRGPMLFRGYYKDPNHTAEVIDQDGWFHTGDLGRLDSEGRLTFTGRLKDMLKVGGENVAAVEVEAFLLGHPAVNIAAVVGVPDAVYTEVPAAFVQLKSNFSVTEEELIDFCLGRIATFKVPRYVRVVDEWPMSGTKIRKFVLRDRLVRELKERGITAAPRLRSAGPSR